MDAVNLTSPETLTKASIRQKVWEYLEKNDIANFPRPVYHRIPNFKGAAVAAQLFATLSEFQAARTVQVSPDKPQDEVRYLVLEQNKDLIVPTPGLAKGLFNRLTAEPGSTKERIRLLASRQGVDELSKPIPMASRLKIDLFIVGSVAVDVTGRHIGKGEGFADLEFAMAASHHQAVGPDTVVVTTVHDAQVFENPLPDHLFSDHDLSVDIIVTPTRIIRVENHCRKPEGIIWNILSKEKFEKIPILKELQFREKKSGREVRLKDEACSENGHAADKSETRKKYPNNFRKPKPKKIQEESDVINGNGTSDPDANSVQLKLNDQSKSEANQRVGKPRQQEPFQQEQPRRRQQQQQRQLQEPQQNDPSRQEDLRKKLDRMKKMDSVRSVGYFIGRIPKFARVKDLKDVIAERGVKVVSLAWKGMKGFAFVDVELENEETEASISAKLHGLQIGEAILNVELDRKQQNGATKSVQPRSFKSKKMFKPEDNGHAQNSENGNPTDLDEGGKSLEPVKNGSRNDFVLRPESQDTTSSPSQKNSANEE